MDLKSRNQAAAQIKEPQYFFLLALDATPKQGGAPRVRLIKLAQAKLHLSVTELFTGKTRGADELPAHPRSSLRAEGGGSCFLLENKEGRGVGKQKKNNTKRSLLVCHQKRALWFIHRCFV